jgi:hypothetical protein
MDKRINTKAAQVNIKATASMRATVKRGSTSWGYFYTLLGFALTIETGVGSMFPLPWSLMRFLIAGAITIYLVLFNGWFQNKLLGWKARYEDAER